MQYRIKIVYNSMTPDEKQLVIHFWLSLNILNEQEANRRVSEVVCLFFNEESILVGVNSVYKEAFLQEDNPYYMYRTLIHPKHRVSYQLLMDALSTTYDFFQERSHSFEERGIGLIIENRKLKRNGAKDRLQKIGFNYLGKNPYQDDVWQRSFT